MDGGKSCSLRLQLLVDRAGTFDVSRFDAEKRLGQFTNGGKRRREISLAPGALKSSPRVVFAAQIGQQSSVACQQIRGNATRSVGTVCQIDRFDETMVGFEPSTEAAQHTSFVVQ